MNVDPQEIHKFEELASRWWDPDSEFKPLHDINPLRANWIDQRAEVADKNLLDVGSNLLYHTEALQLCTEFQQRRATFNPCASQHPGALESCLLTLYETVSTYPFR